MTDATPSQLIDGRIQELGDWRGETLAKVRKLTHEALKGLIRAAVALNSAKAKPKKQPAKPR